MAALHGIGTVVGLDGSRVRVSDGAPRCRLVTEAVLVADPDARRDLLLDGSWRRSRGLIEAPLTKVPGPGSVRCEGNRATVEADGTITLLGRGSNCINTGGEKVYPEEVEEAVKTHPAVTDCLVVGVPDEKFGERVTAVVSLEAGESGRQETLADHVRSQLAGYKVPRGFRFVSKVQRGPNGKADYKWARDIADTDTAH